MDTKKWMAAALEAGACNTAVIAVKDMVFDTAFRDMCAANAMLPGNGDAEGAITGRDG